MELEDRPKPGRDMLIFFHAVCGGILLLVTVSTIVKGDYSAYALTGLAMTVVVCGVVYWFGMSAARGTVYRIGSSGVELRCGILKSFIRYGRILEISRVPSWTGMVRHGIGYQNLGNRFSDYVQLKVKGQSVFITPSDPEAFIAALRERMQRQ